MDASSPPGPRRSLVGICGVRALPVSELAAAADRLPAGEAEGRSRDGLQPPASGWLPGAPKRSSCWRLSVLGSGQAGNAAESHGGAAGPGPVCQPVWPLAHRQDAVCRLPGREGGFLPGEPHGPWGLGTSPEAPGPAPPARGPQVSAPEEGVPTVSSLPPRLPCLTSSTAPDLLFPLCLWSHFSSPLAGGRGGDCCLHSVPQQNRGLWKRWGNGGRGRVLGGT